MLLLLFLPYAQGYTSIRRLSDNERQQMVEFMRLALLCNCTWRFVNFNIDNRSEELIPQVCACAGA